MNTFRFKLVTSNRIFFDGLCEMVVFPASDGLMGILANHENAIIAVIEGEITIHVRDGETISAVVSRGVAQIMNNEVTILVDTAESPEEIDLNRALESKRELEETLRRKKSYVEHQHISSSLARAIARINSKKNIEDK